MKALWLHLRLGMALCKLSRPLPLFPFEWTAPGFWGSEGGRRPFQLSLLYANRLGLWTKLVGFFACEALTRLVSTYETC